MRVQGDSVARQPICERCVKLTRALKALLRIFRQHPHQSGLEVWRQSQASIWHRGRLLHYAGQHAHSLTLKLQPARQHLVEHNAGAIQVGPRPNSIGLTGGLFGRHVGRRTDDRLESQAGRCYDCGGFPLTT